MNVLRKTQSGVVSWKMSTQKPVAIQTILEQKRKMPGPGQYESRGNFLSREDAARVAARGTSSFQSGVARANTAASKTRVGSSPTKYGNLASQMTASQGKFTASATQDIFEDAPEDDVPGPGQYYNSRIHTAFRVTPKEVTQQRFGSSVERFINPAEAKKKSDAASVGPGCYDLQSGFQVSQRSLHQLVSSGFMSSQDRFGIKTKASETPGPAQYQQMLKSESLISVPEREQKFGTREKRFQARVEIVGPGPGAYDQKEHTFTANQASLRKRQRELQEKVHRSQSAAYIRQRSHNNLQHQSYLARSEAEQRKASKNYLNQIQYDTKTNTIGQKAFSVMSSGLFGRRSNPVLIRMKNKRGLPADQVAFGSTAK